MKSYTFILDAGHGIDTPGKRSPVWDDGSQLLEYRFNRQIVEKIENIAKGLGIKTFNVCPEVTDVSLHERCNRANIYMADHPKENCVYVSVHWNAAGVEQAHGFEVFTFPNSKRSILIADEIIAAVKEHLPSMKLRLDNRDGHGAKDARFVVLKKTFMPSILTENGFFTNEKECKKMLTEDFKFDIAVIHILMMQKVIEKGI